MKPIAEVADSLGLKPEHIEPYGRDKAKISLAALEGRKPDGKLILVSAITPTPAGEGKTTCSIGLAQGMALNGVNVAVALREPSLGPFLGMKGGGSGGGKAQVMPADDINMHFNGDLHAVSSAHNLLTAMLDNHMQHGNELNLDPRRVLWKRVMDMNDRSLRNIIVGLGGPLQGMPREAGFDITAASEVMAILCLATSIDDLKDRLSRIVVGYRYDRTPVTAADLKAVGAMAALLRDAIKPNLAQTMEGVPAVIHGGPFANIAHGTNSINATRMAMSYADCVITEAGFAFELGAEKFFDINCRYGDLAPSCTMLVVTLRALKMHGGTPLADVDKPDAEAVKRGLANMEKHIENVQVFGQPCIVAVNYFPSDTDEEAEIVKSRCKELGVEAEITKGFGGGGPGAQALGEKVWALAQKSKPQFKPLYEWDDTIENKIEAVAGKMYGAKTVDYDAKARRDIAQLKKAGYDRLPVCIAKTQYSLSDNPKLLGRPTDFGITVREVQLAAGAGFLVPITGDMLRMPGLPKEPLAWGFDLLPDGEIATGK